MIKETELQDDLVKLIKRNISLLINGSNATNTSNSYSVKDYWVDKDNEKFKIYL